MLQKQKQLARDAQSRRGQNPSNKPGRDWLEMVFSKQVSARLPSLSWFQVLIRV